jgi:hypothetical protein
VARDRVDLLLQLLVFFGHVFRGERLVGEAHVHDARRVAFGSREVDETTLGKHINPPAVLQGEFLNEVPDHPLRH